MAQQLLGPDMALDYDQLLLKQPAKEDGATSGAVFAWHQDQGMGMCVCVLVCVSPTTCGWPLGWSSFSLRRKLTFTYLHRTDTYIHPYTFLPAHQPSHPSVLVRTYVHNAYMPPPSLSPIHIEPTKNRPPKTGPK